MAEQFAQMSLQIEQFRAILADGVLPVPIAERFRHAFFSLELSMQFHTEANKALQAGAWFSAMAVAASALEALLLARCFLEQDRIKELPKWKQLKNSYKTDFKLFAESMDLGKLLEIADQLSWFSEGMPKQFVEVMSVYLDEAALENILALFADTPDVGKICAKHLRDYRNLLHPAVCLRRESLPTQEAGMTGALLVLIALTSLSEKNLVM